MPISSTRLLLHLAAMLCLAALLIQVIQGIAGDHWLVLWTLPGLLLGVPIGYFGGGMIGLHMVIQYCQFPLVGVEISSVLCSG